MTGGRFSKKLNLSCNRCCDKVNVLTGDDWGEGNIYETPTTIKDEDARNRRVQTRELTFKKSGKIHIPPHC